MQTKTCNRCRQDKPITMFHRNKRAKGGFHGYCKDCRRATTKVPPRTPKLKAYQRDQQLRLKYRITLEVKTQMCAANEWKCYLCRREIDLSAHVDECPVTGKIRGILCAYCNRVVMGDVDSGISPNMVLAYLANPLVAQVIGDQKTNFADCAGW